MVASEDSNNKILLFNNNEPPESDLCFSEKKYTRKTKSLAKERLDEQRKKFKEIR